MFTRLLLITLKSVRYRPLRSWLTIIGIVIGTMLVIAIMSLSSGIQNVVLSKLQMLGSQLIIVYPGDETTVFTSLVSGVKFREQDIADLETIPGVRAAVPFDIGALSGEFRGEKKTVTIHSSYWRKMILLFEVTRGFELESGRWPLSDDAAEIVLGNTIAKKLFKSPIHAGDEIIIQSKRMRVAGIMKYVGAQDDDNSVYLSWPLFHMLSETKPAVLSAMIITEPGANIGVTAQQIRFKLSQQTVVDKFSVLTPDNVKKLAGDILNIVELALIMIALVSLIVGAVGIMNTMYTSVLERTKQIGIMKAIGAPADSILTLFIIESGVIGIIGGVIGIIGGVILALVVGYGASAFGGVEGLFSFASLDYFGFLVVLVVTFMTGVIAGILPARQASRMEPAEALRYE